MNLLASILGENGNASSMRVAMLLCVGAAIFISAWPIVHGQAADQGLVLTFLGTAFGGKVWQKAIEQKVKSVENPAL